MFKVIFLLVSFPTVLAFSNELKFFESDPIDYWGKEDIPQKKSPIKKHTLEVHKPKAKKRGPWDKYLKPESIEDLKEVFREGEHTPPVPLLIGIQNPTYKNAKNWLNYIRLKNNLSRPFLEKIRQIKLSETKPKKLLALNTIEQKVSSAVGTQTRDWKRFRFRMYFDSKCPHCKNMFTTLSELKRRGYYVEAVQVDGGKSPQVGNIPTFRASPTELKKYGEERIPFTVVADMKLNRLVGPIRGYHSITSVESFLQKVRMTN